jgi:hypothetical protein
VQAQFRDARALTIDIGPLVAQRVARAEAAEAYASDDRREALKIMLTQ